ncbi:hypothetical protein GCM10022267_03930 [Lentzea roselyniae]|uniref:Uncharacterized protein n=1 Tax=Lentzea roselyniae TaxID=531940 RepID=A0ABP6ZZT0_9PSEU
MAVGSVCPNAATDVEPNAIAAAVVKAANLSRARPTDLPDNESPKTPVTMQSADVNAPARASWTCEKYRTHSVRGSVKRSRKNTQDYFGTRATFGRRKA